MTDRTPKKEKRSPGRPETRDVMMECPEPRSFVTSGPVNYHMMAAELRPMAAIEAWCRPVGEILDLLRVEA